MAWSLNKFDWKYQTLNMLLCYGLPYQRHYRALSIRGRPLRFPNFLCHFHVIIQGLLQPGHRTCSKNSKTPFFGGCFKFLSVGNSNGSKTYPKFFSQKNSKNYSHQPHFEFSMVLAGNLFLVQLDPQNLA